MVWLAFDMSIAISGLALLALGRWLFDLAQRRNPDHRRVD
ncbi:MAG: hypothetical protein JWP89_1894 [Schlesneria sp.]|nr:hypothetical protein [Schlesneria sp.]